MPEFLKQGKELIIALLLALLMVTFVTSHVAAVHYEVIHFQEWTYMKKSLFPDDVCR